MAFGQPYPAGNYQAQGMVLVPVQNETTVNTYLVGAGNTVAFADFNKGEDIDGTLWLKSTTPQGVPNPVRKFELKEITPKPENENAVSREEFTALNDKFDKLLEMLGEGKKHE